jgi:hypothetical protein
MSKITVGCHSYAFIQLLPKARIANMDFDNITIQGTAVVALYLPL